MRCVEVFGEYAYGILSTLFTGQKQPSVSVRHGEEGSRHLVERLEGHVVEHLRNTAFPLFRSLLWPS